MVWHLTIGLPHWLVGPLHCCKAGWTVVVVPLPDGPPDCFPWLAAIAPLLTMASMMATSTTKKVFDRLDILISPGLESGESFIGKLVIASQFYFDLPPPLRSRITGWLGSVGAVPVGLVPLGSGGAWTGLPITIGAVPVPLIGFPAVVGKGVLHQFFQHLLLHRLVGRYVPHHTKQICSPPQSSQDGPVTPPTIIYDRPRWSANCQRHHDCQSQKRYVSFSHLAPLLQTAGYRTAVFY
jgi:hypothetical protein